MLRWRAGWTRARCVRCPPRRFVEFQALTGLGPFSAELVLLRGAGHPDCLPAHESRLPRAVERAFGLDRPPTLEELGRLAEAWQP
jgi:DNA-3-methyladenine glycosylase II